MLSFPTATTRDEKMEVIKEITKRLLLKHEETILAIGAYGSIGAGYDGPFSDIEMHVITKDGSELDSLEFIYDKFKIEISTKQKTAFFNMAKKVDDSWAIKASAFTKILPLYDPEQLFEAIKTYPLQLSEYDIKETMREFMVWEPYETIAKIRNNYKVNNLNYIPMGAQDLVWQTAKLIGLANKRYYSTRAKVYEESIVMTSKPLGYDALVKKVMAGELANKEAIYGHCEQLWEGLNIWYRDLGIDYKSKQLPL